MREPKLILGSELVKFIAEIDEFKGRWEALKTLSPDRLNALRKVATIESVGSSTRIEGAKLSDAQVESLLSKIAIRSFKTRDEQEVAGYAEAMDLVFEAFGDLRLTENHVRQLHQTLLRHSDKDERHRGSYKTLANHVVAIDADGKEIGIVFETAMPFDTPREMEDLIAWTRKAIDEEALHPLLIAAVSSWSSWRYILFRMATGGFRAFSRPCFCYGQATGMFPTPRWSVSSKKTKNSITRRSDGRKRRSRAMHLIGNRGLVSFCAASKSKKIALRCGWSAKGLLKHKTMNYPTWRFRCSKRCERQSA